MAVFLSFYVAFGILLLIYVLIKGGIKALPIMVLAAIAIPLFPFALLYIIVAHWNSHNRWGIIFFLACMIASVIILLN